jgi:hypothetical protein
MSVRELLVASTAEAADFIRYHGVLLVESDRRRRAAGKLQRSAEWLIPGNIVGDLTRPKHYFRHDQGGIACLPFVRPDHLRFWNRGKDRDISHLLAEDYIEMAPAGRLGAFFILCIRNCWNVSDLPRL